MSHVLLIRHGHGPEDDRVAAFFAAARVETRTVKPFAGEEIGDLDGLAGAVIFGGPFVVFDECHHFLRDEARVIAQCLTQGLPLLGICQGAQQIAHFLGARVGPHPEGLHEFGYCEVRPTEAGRDVLPAPLHLAQSHYHGFDLPEGAELLASSDSYSHQAFRFGSALAFQFHAEVTPDGFRRWQQADWAPYGQPGAQSRAEQARLMALHDAAQHAWFTALLARHFAAVLAQASAESALT